MPRKTTQRPPSVREREAKGRVGGTPADRLVRAWLDGDDDGFEDLAEELIAGGRDGVLAAATRKLAEKHEDDDVDDFADDLTEMAEAAEGQREFDFASLVLLPVAPEDGALPDLALLASGLAASGAFPVEAESTFVPGWRTADAILALSPSAVRRVLLDIAGGRPPADLPPLQPGGVEADAILVMTGASVFRKGLPEDDPGAVPDAGEAAEAAKDREHMEAFERWRASLGPKTTNGASILPLCAPSALAYEIEAFFGGTDPEGDAVLEEVRDFIETAEGEAGGEEVVARFSARDDGVEVAVLTRSGRELDRRMFPLEEGGVTADKIVDMVGERMPVVDGTS